MVKDPACWQLQKKVVGFADDKVQVHIQQSPQKEAAELNGKHTLQE